MAIADQHNKEVDMDRDERAARLGNLLARYIERFRRAPTEEEFHRMRLAQLLSDPATGYDETPGPSEE